MIFNEGNFVSGSKFFKCTLCNIDLKGGIVAIERHEKTNKHVSKECQVNTVKTKVSIFDHAKQHGRLNEQVKIAEIRLAAFIAQRNLSFNTSDPLVSMIKSLDPSSAILKGITCGRTKCTGLVNNAIGKQNFDYLLEEMNSKPFSILIDESTDTSFQKDLVVVARIVSEKDDTYVVNDNFLCLLPVKDATAQGIYTILSTFFNENKIEYKQNLIGFAADGAATMTGRLSSVSVLLGNDVPHLFVMKCVCHSLARCLFYAMGKLPAMIEKVIKNTYLYIRYSCKRLEHLKQIQCLLNLKMHKILKVCDTRWLSHKEAVQRILEQYIALKEFFQKEVAASPGDETASGILQMLQSPLTEVYLQFLNYSLSLVCDLNVEFQSELPKIYCLHSRVEGVYRTILSCYIKPNILQKQVNEIQYRNPANYVPLDQIYIGPHGSLVLSKLNVNQSDLQKFRVNCLNFLVELSHQLYTRFPFNDPTMKGLKTYEFLNPNNFSQIQSITPAVAMFENRFEDIYKLDEEYRKLKFMGNENQMKQGESVLKFWKRIGDLQLGNEQYMFPNLTKLVKLILTLPHSSACVERIFSTITLNKTKTRNRLQEDSLSGIIRTQGTMKKEGKSSHDFDAQKILQYYNYHNLYK